MVPVCLHRGPDYQPPIRSGMALKWLDHPRPRRGWPMTRCKRGNGEGTVFRRVDGRWVGEITVGFNEAGRQKRRTVYGNTQAEVRQKLDELRQQAREGTLDETTMTVGGLADFWLLSQKASISP